MSQSLSLILVILVVSSYLKSHRARAAEKAFIDAQQDEAFQQEFRGLLKNYLGRPTPLSLCRNCHESPNGTKYISNAKICYGGCT